MAYNSKIFFKTTLGEIYSKFTTEKKYKFLEFNFDVKNEFVNYEGTAMLSHYHEAAYDAHMTGLSFAYIRKLKDEHKAQKAYTEYYLN